jgi:hypothetical protein
VGGFFLMIFDEIWDSAMAAQFSLKLHRNIPHHMGNINIHGPKLSSFSSRSYLYLKILFSRFLPLSCISGELE